MNKTSKEPELMCKSCFFEMCNTDVICLLISNTRLRKDLSESSTLVQSLKIDLQRKEEEYTDLKEKFSDAKKQIQQVQKEVGNRRPNVFCTFMLGVLLLKPIFTNLKLQI